MKTMELVKRIMMNIGVPFLLLAVFPLLGVLIADAVHAAGVGARVGECVSPGDSEVSMKISKKVVAYSIKKWEIADLVDEEKTEKAKNEMYDFLNWKLGSPTLVCTQYSTAGQKHFNKVYNDEAAAALLGTELPGGDRAEIQLSKEHSKKLKSLLKKGEKPLADYLSNKLGWGEEISQQVIAFLSAPATAAVDRIGFNIPKKWDFSNRAVKDLIAAKRKAMEKEGEKE